MSARKRINRRTRAAQPPTEEERLAVLVEEQANLISAMQHALGIVITDGTDWSRERLLAWCRHLCASGNEAQRLAQRVFYLEAEMARLRECER